MRDKVLIGQQIEHTFKFYSRYSNELINVQDATLKIYDSKQNLLHEKDISTNNVLTGIYVCSIIIPHHTPFVYIEASGLNDGVTDVKREKVYTFFSYDDMDSGYQPVLTEYNSYLSFEEAWELMKNVYNVQHYYAATEDNQKRALMVATEHIDALILKGRKLDSEQKLQFPRIINNKETDEDIVKKACLYEAIAILSDEFQNRENLIQQGVSSIKIGDITESYTKQGKRLYSKDAMNILKSYIANTVQIR